MNNNFDITFEEIVTLIETAKVDHEKANLKDNASAARRARTALSQVKKLIPEYRQASLDRFAK